MEDFIGSRRGKRGINKREEKIILGQVIFSFEVKEPERFLSCRLLLLLGVAEGPRDRFLELDQKISHWLIIFLREVETLIGSGIKSRFVIMGF